MARYMTRLTKADHERLDAERAAAHAQHEANLALQALAWRAAAMMPHEQRIPFVSKVCDGSLVLDAVKVERDVAAWVAGARLHEGCKAHALKYASIAYLGCVKPDECEGCAKPLLCGGEDRPHQYVEIGSTEARERGIYHGGACYHVTVCGLCGHVSAYDSSD